MSDLLLSLLSRELELFVFVCEKREKIPPHRNPDIYVCRFLVRKIVFMLAYGFIAYRINRKYSSEDFLLLFCGDT